jgi:hypothetical protein
MTYRLNLSTYWFECPECYHNFIFKHVNDNSTVETVAEKLSREYGANYIEKGTEIYLEFKSQADMTYFILKYT